MIVGDLLPAATPLRDRLGSIPAIGWLKDIEGRYLFANRCYIEQLGTSEDTLLGRTDAELPPREAIDGPRLRDGSTILDSLIQVEYRVGALDGRPELAVMRFPIRDQAGTPVAVCGIAAPIADHGLPALCAELLELAGQGSTPSPARLSVAPPADEPLEVLANVLVDDELDRERRRADRLEHELAVARAELESLRRETRDRVFSTVQSAPALG
jgi:hypothetical protein